MSDAELTPRFIEGGSGRIFVLIRRPRRAPSGSVLIVPPFAEEMNKSRRMFTDIAHALAERAVATVLPDLYGTGDSEGELRDADWDGWLDDLARTAAWSAGQGCPIDALLCLRTGCLLGAQAARLYLNGIRHCVFWQPVTEGERFVLQFLRLSVAASMMEGSSISVAALRERLRRGEQLEVAGYQLSARLIGQLERLRLADELSPRVGHLFWMELVRGSDGAFPAASQRNIEAAVQAGITVTALALVGEPFWSSIEIVRTPTLIAKTVDALAPC